MLPYTDETDATLVRLTLRGDSRAYDALIARHRKLLYAIAYAELLDDDAADDVVQDALVRAYERLDQLRAPDLFSSWIARVVVSCAWAQNRSTSRNRAAIDQLDPPPTELVPNTSRLDREELASRALAAAPPDCRRVLLMRYVADASFREIGQVLLITGDAAEKRLRRGLRAMRAYLRRAGLDEDCRDALRKHGLGITAAPKIADMADTALSRHPRSYPRPRDSAAGAAGGWAAAALGVAALLGSLGGMATILPIPWGSLKAHASTASTRQAAGGMEVLLLSSVHPRVRMLVAPGDELSGWQAMEPGKDATLPAPAGDAVEAAAAMLSNDFGVVKAIPNVIGRPWTCGSGRRSPHIGRPWGWCSPGMTAGRPCW